MVFVKRDKLSKQVKEIMLSHICLKIPEPVDFFVAVPTLADEGVFGLIESLAEARVPDDKRVSVVVLVNNSEDASDQVKRKNDEIFERLEKFRAYRRVSVYARAIKDMPRDIAGVGFARRILMNEAICVFVREFISAGYQDFIEFLKKKLIFSLDSDCIISSDYFEKAYEFLEKLDADFGIFLFEHRFSENLKVRVAGILWELFLRYWRDSLRIAGYPFAFYPIGSLFVFRGYLYPIVGRINLRKAGEDFYFLQKVLHSFKVIDVPAFVFPKAEPSSRTPFGTGYEILQYVNGNESRLKYVWDYRSFDIIKKVLEMENPDIFLEFLDANPKYKRQIQNMRQYLKDYDFARAFVRWFNPFKVLKFLRYLEKIYTRSPIELEVQKLVDDINQRGFLDLGLNLDSDSYPNSEFLGSNSGTVEDALKQNEAELGSRAFKFLRILRFFDMKFPSYGITSFR